jgi:hypothetical protein
MAPITTLHSTDAAGIRLQENETVPLLVLRQDAVAGFKNLFIEPHLHVILPQPLGQRAHARVVLRAVAQESVMGEGFGAHGRFLFTR